MAESTNEPKLNEVRGTCLRRFVVNSAMLNLIDPVRGDPTRHTLDEDPNNDTSSVPQLKLKFLDSFALICSTSAKGRETASAVCLEEQHPDGAILRMARNRGFTLQDIAGLEKLMGILRGVANRSEFSSPECGENAEVDDSDETAKTPVQAELEILRLVSVLDRYRILSMSEKIEKQDIRSKVKLALSRLMNGFVREEGSPSSGIRIWLESCPFLAMPSRDWNPENLFRLIDWSSKVRWSYQRQFRILLSLDRSSTPVWLDSLHKVARYHSAVKSMVKFASKQPQTFRAIQMSQLAAPVQHRFSISGERSPLSSAVKRLVKNHPEQTIKQLEQRLGTSNSEAKLKKACCLDLTLHAEMQLVVFYARNPSATPQFSFMGTSKKACYFCAEYLRLHPLRIRTSASHQKVYPTWMPPPDLEPAGRHKNTTFDKLSYKLEQLLYKDLKESLTMPRRPNNQDSTAGPNLTTSATLDTAGRSWQAITILQNRSAAELSD